MYMAIDAIKNKGKNTLWRGRCHSAKPATAVGVVGRIYRAQNVFVATPLLSRLANANVSGFSECECQVDRSCDERCTIFIALKLLRAKTLIKRTF